MVHRMHDKRIYSGWFSVALKQAQMQALAFNLLIALNN